MSTGQDPSKPLTALPSNFLKAGADWVERGRPQRLIRWLERQLVDPEGLPALGQPDSWWLILESLADWLDARPSDWPEPLNHLASLLLRNALRFSRTDGSPVFGPEGPPPGRADLVRRWVTRLDDPALRTVSQWWFPPRGRSAQSAQTSSPPLPAISSERRVLAMLRPDWLARGDFLAVHQPADVSASRIELRAQGRWLIGPDWSLPDPQALAKSPRRLLWSTLSRADALEWSLRSGPSRITRTAVLLRGARIALLADQIAPVEPHAAVSLPLSPEVSASLAPDQSHALLKAPGLKAHVIPLVLTPETGQPPARLSLDDRRLIFEVPTTGKRVWAAWLVVWDSDRTRRAPVVRPLTVTTRTVRCPADVAQAYRIGWGAGQDSLIVYRSLIRPDLRTFLGQQTTARFLIGWFNASGNLTPLLTVPT